MAVLSLSPRPCMYEYMQVQFLFLIAYDFPHEQHGSISRRECNYGWPFMLALDAQVHLLNKKKATAACGPFRS